jgi:hypothetical protein
MGGRCCQAPSQSGSSSRGVAEGSRGGHARHTQASRLWIFTVVLSLWGGKG